MPVRHCIIACAALLAAGPFEGELAAQPAPEPNIFVTGEREPPKWREITEQARNVSIIGNPLDNPLPRFEGWVCPGVVGLKEEGAAYVIQRLRFNAEQYNLRLAEDDGTCEPNLIVAFVEDPQNQLVELARSQGYMLAGMSVDQRGELLDASGAARVWVNTLTRTGTGMPVPTQRDASMVPERAISYSEAGGPVKIQLPPVASGWAMHSRIYFATREDIVSVMVLFDRDQVRGKTLLQLADYATMRSFAFTRETRGEPAAATILSLFDGDGPKPERLTAFDLAYLESLYEGLPNLPAQSKIADVKARMQSQRADRE